ncbi:MAG: acetolactate synthase small subunit [Spirochaetaceae bacterium]|nr:MAG: acetolactate synthase small subunit [Spirochaetaceae bacterium]
MATTLSSNGTSTNGTGTRPYRKHTLSLLVNNKPGVLIRIALVFARRAYNIDSLVVSPSKDPSFSVMNIVASGDEKVLDQILKQLNKLVDVLHASDRTGQDIIQRELALFKLHCEQDVRSDVLQLAHAMNCEIVEVSEHATILQMTGDTERLDSAHRVFEKYGVEEMIRTGKVLMARGQEITS